jgi:hypothetical protein
MEQSELVCHQVETIHAPNYGTSPLSGEHGMGSPPFHGSVPFASGKRKSRLAILGAISGSVLSGLGFIALTLYQNYADSLNELHRDLKHFNEASADLVKKDSLQRMREQLREYRKETQAAALARAQMEHEWQAGERDRKELASELQRLRERLAAVEGRQAATPVVLPVAPPPKAAR